MNRCCLSLRSLLRCHGSPWRPRWPRPAWPQHRALRPSGPGKPKGKAGPGGRWGPSQHCGSETLALNTRPCPPCQAVSQTARGTRSPSGRQPPPRATGCPFHGVASCFPGAGRGIARRDLSGVSSLEGHSRQGGRPQLPQRPHAEPRGLEASLGNCRPLWTELGVRGTSSTPPLSCVCVSSITSPDDRPWGHPPPATHPTSHPPPGPVDTAS